jgi:hypothetical protein
VRTLITLVALVAALAVGVSTALATTGTGSGGGLTVTVSLPDTATQGAPFTAAESITNTLTSRQFVKVTQTLAGPGGRVFSFSYPIILGPSKSLAFRFTVTLPAFVPDGTYTLTLTAKTGSGTASASATTTVS